MINKVSLNGYITQKPTSTPSSDGLTRTEFILNVPRNYADEDGRDLNIYDYIPIIMYNSSDKDGLPKNYSDDTIKVQGRLITYPDYHGQTQWGVMAKSVSADKPFNPFQPN